MYWDSVILKTEPWSRRESDPMEELVAAIIRQAINDGVKNSHPYTETFENKETYEYNWQRAREWVRDAIPTHLLHAVERFWDYPYCQCGRPLTWPYNLCKKCRGELNKEDS